ncbi:hypothetical protein [Labilibaculum euxinus]
MNKQIPRNIVSILLLFIVLLFSAGTSNAQHYPVQCNVQLIPPYSVHLADYYQGSNQKLLVNLTLKDLNHADLSVRLRISIEGQGIKLITKDDFIPKAPVLLQAGTPELLYGDRLEEYLAPEHMNFSGITQKQFLKTGRLPEGVYKFTVEVFEARRQEKVSNTATSMAWMLLNEPPVITAPANNKLLKATDPASIFFNWLPRHMNSQNALADVEYEFTMVEIWPVNQSAEEAIRSKEPLLKTVFRNTSFVYDAQYPMLVPGRQYACRVRAFSSQQKEMFKNEGYSPVVSLVFGEECKPPLMVDVDPALGGSAQLSIVPQSNHSSFTVQIRDVAGDKWYSQQSNQPDFELKQLKPGATYQYKVQAQCETLESEFTPISQFSLSKEQAEVECGQSAAIPEIDGSPALNQLTAGDVINAGGFKVTVKQVSGSRGTFTGSGVVRIGMLGNIELRTIFDNIKVNESYQLTAGEIRVVGSDIYALGSDIRDQADDFFNNDIWDSVDDAIADAESIVDEISNLQTDMGDNSLNNELEKAKRTIEKGRDQLAVGNKEGAQLVKEGADKVAQILDQVNSGDFQITANGIFFFAHSSQSYGFDSHDEGLTEEEKKAYLPYYESLQLGDTTKQYYLKAWKSIGSNGNDVVNVKMQLSNGMKADTVHFMNAMGAEITPQKQGDAFSLNLRGSFHEDVQQITAYYNVKDDSTKKTKKVPLGALNVISYDQIEKNLVLVPVNGNSTSIPRAQLETYLNDTYSPANVRWTVSRHAGVEVEYSDDMSQGLDDGESKMLSNYTKEMNKVIKALKRSGDYDKHKTYVFLVDKAKNPAKAGFMPKKRPWGFVFTNIHYNNSKALCRTISHEVAHGEFRLSHPFQDFPSIPENSTQNLMDYADGQQLRKYQWDDIHNLRDVELWGQEEEGNASHDVNINGLITWIKGNKGSHLDLVQNKFYNFNVWGNKALETKLAGQKAWVYSEVFDDGKIDLQTPHVDFVINEDYHSGFYLSYKYEGKSEDAVRIWTYSYSDFELLLKDLEYPLDDKFKTKIVASYEEYLEVNGADCNKIDVVFENIPDFVNATISIEDRIKYLKTISGCSIFNGRWIWGTENDTNEGLAVLNLLKTKDEQQKNALFYKLENENKLLIDLYDKLGGDNLEQFIQVLSGLAVDSWSKDNLDVDGNVYYIWNDSSVDVKGRIEGDVLNIWSHIMPGSFLSQNPIPINNEKFDPLEALAICYNDGEVASDDKVVYLPALYLYWLADNKNTEDGIKSVSFFLNFVGAGSASKVLFKGGTYLAKVLAIAELSNFALNTLITNPILAERLKQTDEGKVFLEVWPTISTTIDLAQISTELLTSFVKNSKSVSNVLSDLPEAEAKRLDDLIAKSDEVLVKRGMPIIGIEDIPLKYRVEIFNKIKVITKDISLPKWIKESFADSYYYTAETMESLTVFRRFGGGANQAKLLGGFSSTQSVLSRNELAVLKKWSNMRFEAELMIEQGAKVNLGKIAPQSGYKGGADQVLLPLDYSENWVKSVKDLKTGNVYTFEEFKLLFPDQIQ